MPNLTLLRPRNLLKKGYKDFPSRINIQDRYKVWQQLNISRMVSWKSLIFGMELRAFKFYSLQFFQLYTVICFRDTKLTRIFLNGNRG
jgi:hypothetical protein